MPPGAVSQGMIARALLTAMALCTLAGCFSGPRWRGPPSDHFDGEKFQNVLPFDERGACDLVRWQLARDQGPWPEFRDVPPGERPPARVGAREMRVTFVNHATALVQMDGLNILTDPIWSERASPVSWAGPRR